MDGLISWLESRLMCLPPRGFWSLRVNDEYRPRELHYFTSDWQAEGPWEYDEPS